MRAHEPTADIALFWCLGGILAIAGAFFFVFYSMMRPTVVANAAYVSTVGDTISAAYVRAPVSGSTEDREQAAIETAELENRKLKLAPVAAFASAQPPAALPKPVHVTQAKAKPKPKPKRVVREQAPQFFGNNQWMASSGGQTRGFGFFW
jgi:hypothetical protein